MNIDAWKKTVTMSVGEFARFSLVSSVSTSASNSLLRAQAGQIWHSKIQSEFKLAPDEPNWLNEQSVSGSIDWMSWKFNLKGRIDQLANDSECITLREIKTTTTPLPFLSEEIKSLNPEHLIQLLTYRELLLRNQEYKDKRFTLELLYVNIGTGERQIHTLPQSAESLLHDQFTKLHEYLEANRERLLALRTLKHNPAYEVPRQGQESIQDDLSESFTKSKLTCLVAPTGYGKTGVAWEAGLKKLASGEVDRIIYLTSKTTGQIEAVHRLQALLEDNESASFWNIRNKQEHCINGEFRCSLSSCRFLSNIKQKWDAKGMERLYLFSNDDINIDEIRDEGKREEICPYELMRAGIGFRDIWLADYNYLFSPKASKLFSDQPNFDPKRTFLIIDEAHNLADRVRSIYSLKLEREVVEYAIQEIQSVSHTARIQLFATILLQEISPIRKGQKLGPHGLEKILDAIDSLAKIVLEEIIDYESFAPSTNELLWAIAHLSQYRKKLDLKLTGWAPSDGTVALSCLDASEVIRKTLSPFSNTLFLTATLPPFDSFCQSIGFDDSDEKRSAPILLTPPAPWRDTAYDVAIDLRIDTRLRSRQESTPILAQTIAKLAESQGPIVVFFPSYAYANATMEALGASSPFLRVEIQTNQGSPQERREYIESSLMLNDALFLVLGSSYSEGIDLLGGKLKLAIVVSPALPEVNPLRDAEMEQYKGNRKLAFERVYQQPGIQKVNQALGRLVRAPGQHVKVLLACNRFAEPKTQKLLDTPYRGGHWIMEGDELEDWLSSESTTG
ncbi:PD-(D/E)XK nuclease family protein [Puniceicoccaceae bacterium K14]|nr:PD-(D/E)XK nuclease family protein [Puniceicoccaceae bacterium K14]